MKKLYYVISLTFFYSTIIYNSFSLIMPVPKEIIPVSKETNSFTYIYKKGTAALPEGNLLEKRLESTGLYRSEGFMVPQNIKNPENNLLFQYLLKKMAEAYKLVEGKEIDFPTDPFSVDAGIFGIYTCFARRANESFSIQGLAERTTKTNECSCVTQ